MLIRNKCCIRYSEWRAFAVAGEAISNDSLTNRPIINQKLSLFAVTNILFYICGSSNIAILSQRHQRIQDVLSK